jgi:hypothetical protein
MTEYFSACQVLHGDLYEFKDAFLADTTQEDIGKFFWVYLNHWLSSLWIVARAFQHVLKLQDRIINRLIDENFQNLSAYRNVTYHYHRLPNKRIQARARFMASGRLNWAEELHSELERYFREYLAHLAAFYPEDGQEE